MNPPTNNSVVRNCNETDVLGMSISIYNYTIYSTEIQINYRKKQGCLLVLLNGVPTYQTNGKQCRNGISDDGLVFNSETCGIKFSHADWREKQIVKITGQTDQLVNIKDRIVFLRLYNSDEVTPIQDLLYWKNIHLPDIKVI